MGSQFDAKKAEASNRQLPRDAKRAEIKTTSKSCKYSISEEKFSNVVNWLRTNAAEGGSIPKPPFVMLRLNLYSIDKGSHTLFPDKPGETLFLDRPVFSAATTASSGTPCRLALFFNNSIGFCWRNVNYRNGIVST